MSKVKLFLLFLVFIVVPLYPKFPLVGISGTFVSVRLEDFVLAFIVIVWLITSLIRRYSSLSLPVHRAILLYLLIGFISLFSAIFLTKTASLSLGLLHALRRVEYMCLFFVAYDFLNHLRDLPKLIRTILLVSLIVAIYGLGQQFLGWPIISTTNSEFAKGLALSLGPGGRINSTFAGHYDLAAYTLFPLLILLGLALIPFRRKWLLLLIGTPIYLTLLLTISRFTIIAFFVMAGVMILIHRRRLLLLPLSLLAIVSLIFTPGLLGRYQQVIVNHLLVRVPPVAAQQQESVSGPVDEQVPDALKTPDKPEDRSTNIRLNVEWPRAIRSITKNPLLGTGYSSVGLATDNGYLRSMAETGLLGFFAFILIVFRLLKNIPSYLKSPPQNFVHSFILSSTLALVGLLINTVFIDIFEASKIAITIWAIMGISYRAGHLANNEKS